MIWQGTILIWIYKFKYICKKKKEIWLLTLGNEEAVLLEKLLFFWQPGWLWTKSLLRKVGSSPAESLHWTHYLLPHSLPPQAGAGVPARCPQWSLQVLALIKCNGWLSVFVSVSFLQLEAPWEWGPLCINNAQTVCTEAQDTNSYSWCGPFAFVSRIPRALPAKCVATKTKYSVCVKSTYTNL